MFQDDYRDAALPISRAAYRRDVVGVPLWLHGWRALRSAAGTAARQFAWVVETLERSGREAVTVRELSALRDKELRDIGIERSQIPFIARSLAQEEDPRRVARSQHRENVFGRDDLTLISRQNPAQPCCS